MNEHFLKQRKAARVGGMGAMAPMKRSATAVEMYAHNGATRVARTHAGAAFTARHDRQVGLCKLTGCGVRAGAAQ